MTINSFMPESLTAPEILDSEGEIGVKDGIIVSVSNELEGEALYVIDAEHQIVCPGFIDVYA